MISEDNNKDQIFQEAEEMWEFFTKGGLVMIPLGFCSFTAIIIIIERILFFYFTEKDETQDKDGIKPFLREKSGEVKMVSNRGKSAVARLTAAAIEQMAKDPDLLETTIQKAGDYEVKRLQRGLGLLDTIVTASPLLGLLGTVTGIIRSFTALSVQGGAQATQLSLGIAEALYTTAFGLAIAIPSLFFLNFFYSIAERRVESLTLICEEILTTFKKG